MTTKLFDHTKKTTSIGLFVVVAVNMLMQLLAWTVLWLLWSDGKDCYCRLCVDVAR